MTKTAERIHRVAVYTAWMSTAMMATMTGLVYIVNTQWFILTMVHRDPAYSSPRILDAVVPEFVLILGFIIIVSALLGGFRKES